MTDLKQHLAEALSRNVQFRQAMQSLIRGYVCLLEAGRDRIISYGGQCESVEIMERGDQHLNAARDFLAALPQQANP